MDITALKILSESQYSHWTPQLSEYNLPGSTANGHHQSQNTIGQSVQPMDTTALRILLAILYSQWTPQLSELASKYSQWTSQLSEYDCPVSIFNGHHSSQNTIGKSVHPMDITVLRI